MHDPRWHQLRLKIIARDENTCQRCGAKCYMLHVHHLKYAKSGNPWDAAEEDLQSLCVPCHKAEHGRKETECAKKKRLARERTWQKREQRKRDRFNAAFPNNTPGEPSPPA